MRNRVGRSIPEAGKDRMANRRKRLRVLKRDQRLCGIHFGGCGRRIEEGEKYNVDHIIPRALFSRVAKGRNAEFNEDWNYQPMHVACNDAKASQLRGWPRFDCDCHYLQIGGRDLYVYTKGHVGEGMHLLLRDIVSGRNDKVDAHLVVGSGKGKGGSNIVGYRQGQFGYLLPGIAPSNAEMFNLAERSAVGLPVPEIVQLDNEGHVVRQWGNPVSTRRRSISAETFNNRALSLAGLGRLEDALQDYDEAIRIRPMYPEALRNRGVAKAKLNRTEDAIFDFGTAISQKPDFSEAYFNRGLARYELERYVDALADYDQCIRTGLSDAATYSSRGLAKNALGQYEKSLPDFDKAIALDPRDVKALNNRAATYFKLGRTTDAIADFEEAVALRPNCAELHYNMGLVRITLSDFENAKRNLQTAEALAKGECNANLAAMAVRALGGLPRQ